MDVLKSPELRRSRKQKGRVLRSARFGGMVNVRSLRCAGDGCSKQPSYGVAGRKAADYCVQHALEGMVDVCSKKCAGDGCSKISVYSVAGSKKKEYCAQHALEGMVNVYSKTCAGNGCSKRPSYGITGSKKAEYLRWACVGGDGERLSTKKGRQWMP